MNTRLIPAAIIALAGHAAAQQYTVTDLGTLGGPVTSGFGINEQGHAVGAGTIAAADFHGLYSAGSAPTAIAPLAGDSQCWAFAVDAGGTVVAMSFSFGALATRGLMWNAGVPTSLGNFAPRAISSAGVLAGFTTVLDLDQFQVDHAASWVGGTMTDLGTLGGANSYAAGINEYGQVVGWSATTGDTAIRAVLWQGGVPRDLGTLGGATSQAYAISNNRGIVGVADTASGQPHAFFMSVDAAGTVTSRLDLGTLTGGFSYAYGLNNAADVVGTSGSRAFLWHAGTMIDLNTRVPSGTGWVLERAWSINSRGQIVGTGLYNGFARGFLLTPACHANCDGSSVQPVLNVSDFICFQTRYAAGDPYANCDGSTIPPILNVSDFICFQQKYASGCP